MFADKTVKSMMQALKHHFTILRNVFSDENRTEWRRRRAERRLFRIEQRRRRAEWSLRRACSMEKMRIAPNSVRDRFPDGVLLPLLDAGWCEGRTWEPELLDAFVARFDIAFPPAVVQVLSEFGGLDVGDGRLISFGYIDDHLCASFATLEELVGEPLFPIGNTNIFEDDGLGVLMDGSGRLYVDGATGDKPPRDHRLDLIETDINRFLSRIFSPGPTPEMQSWHLGMHFTQVAPASSGWASWPKIIRAP